MNKKIKLGLIILAVMLLTIIYFIWQHYRQNLPVMNPKPSRFITVSGHLDEGLYLKIGASYATDQNICWHYSNYEEGLKQPNFYHFVYTPTVDSNNNYSVTIPLDALQPGHCRWGVGGLYSIMSATKNFHLTNESLLVGFYDKSKPATNPTFSMLCDIGAQKNRVYCRFPKTMRTDFDVFNLYTGTSNIQINFIKEKE